MTNNIHKCLVIIVLAIVMAGVGGCKKYLDAKPDKKLAVPGTLQDLQALIDFSPVSLYDPGSDEVSADNYYLNTASYQALPLDGDRRMYTWEKDDIFQTYPNDWSEIYKRIYYMNTVLESLSTIERTALNAIAYDYIKGQALLLRGKSFLSLSIIFSKVYDEQTAATDPGVPLKVNADFTATSVRASLKETFDLLLSDLRTSVPLLPVKPVHVSRCSRPGAYGYLSRAYLYMRKYVEAGKYADSCLQLQNTLMDYNQLNAAAAYPVPLFNSEEIMFSSAAPVQLIPSEAIIDSVLYASFEDNDLRKQIFFENNGNGTYIFKGSYDNSWGDQFTGIAADEVYLTRAECYARNGDIQMAMNDLNTLMIKRWKAGLFVPLTAGNMADALALVLTERRKELMLRGTRFMDIKRLNKEGAGISLKRIVDGKTYLLPPNDLRYALPIPEIVISISGMQQNAR